MGKSKKTVLVLSLAAFAMMLAGAVWYVFGEEDYYPEPGSFEYYLKLSSAIRNFPVILPAKTPSYYGTVGDGSKLPQSAISYITLEKDEKTLVRDVTSYLVRERFSLDEPEQAPHAIDSGGKEMVYRASYARDGARELLEFQVFRLPASGNLEIKATHLE